MSAPRTARFYGTLCGPVRVGKTWLEDESFCYPNGGMTRRARVRCPDDVLRTVTCGIPDTFFSIPARLKIDGKTLKGYVTIDDKGEFEFRFCKDDLNTFWRLLDVQKLHRSLAKEKHGRSS